MVTPSTNNKVRSGLYGVLGHRISYTMSPAIFHQVFSDLGWSAVYGVLDRSPAEMRNFVKAAHMAGFIGLNVTQPYKVSVIPLLNSLDESARLAGAVNTICFRGGRSIGYNTDLDGVRSVLRRFRRPLQESYVMILGAGGAARATMAVLLQDFSVKCITIAARSNVRGQRLISTVNLSSEPHASLESIPLESRLLHERLAECSLLINATPAGTTGNPNRNPLPANVSLPKRLIVFDLVYRPRQTPLLQRAAAAGCATLGGWGMLVAQAESSFRIWTGRGFPVSSRRLLERLT